MHRPVVSTICLVTLCLSAVLWFLRPANGETAQQRICSEKSGASAEQRIKACTAVIKSEKDGWNRGLALAYRGDAYSDLKDYDQAIKDYDESNRLHPNMATLFNNRGAAYSAKGNHARAVEDFDEAIRLAPTNAKTYRNRGDSYSDMHDYDRAIADYNEAIRLNPKYAGAFNARGNAYYDKSENDLAIQDFSNAIRFDQNTAGYYYGRARTYRDKGDYDRALIDFNEAIRRDPKFSMAYYGRGRAYLIVGDLGSANRDFNAAIEFEPNDAWSFYYRARVYRAMGNFDLAIADLDTAIRLKPDEAWNFYGRGRAYQAKGDRDRAKQDFNQALRLKSDFVEELIREGTDARNKGYRDKYQFDLAVDYFNGAIEIDPNNSVAYYNRALVVLGKGGAQGINETDRAMVDFDRAVQLKPDYVDALLGRGDMFRNRNDYAGAVADYDRAIAALAAKAPDDVEIVAKKPLIFSQRCFAKSMMNDQQGALADCDEAQRLRPTHPPYNRAAVYLKLKQFDKAIAGYETILKVSPKDPSALYGRGLGRIGNGDAVGGNADIAAARNILPTVVEGFSSWYGVTSDGSAAAPTAASILQSPSLMPSPPVAKTAELPSAPGDGAVVSDVALLREIRDRLYELNFDPGSSEITFGDGARQAIREFEEKTGLTQTGQPTLGLLKRLREAATPSPWGTIVFAKATGKWGMSWGQATRKEAVSSAIASCGNARECAIELSFSGAECAAFAYSGATFALVARDNAERARVAALADCQKTGRTCRIVTSFCANGSEQRRAGN